MAAFSAGDLLGRAFGWTFGHVGVLARLAWPPVLFALILRLAIGWLWSGDTAAMATTGQPSGGAVLAILLSALVILLAIALIAVSWHRYVLRGEVAPFPTDAATFRFLLYQIWLGFLGLAVLFLAVIVLSIVLGAVGGPSIVQAMGPEQMLSGGIVQAFIIQAVVTALITVPFAFYGLVFPATAIGDRGLVAAESRRLLRGHRGAALQALIAVPILFLVLSTVIGLALDAVWTPDGELGAGMIIVNLILLLITVFEVSVFAGVLSELYRVLRLPELAGGTAPE